MRKLYTFLLTTLTLLSFSQQGDFLLTEHFPRQSTIDNTNFEIINDNLGRLCVANRSGVLKYDGEAWDFYKTPSAALSIAVDTSNVVYVGCIGSVGMIDFQERSIVYQPLIEGDSINDLFLETLYKNEKVFFLSSEKLVVYDIQKRSANVYSDFYLNLFELDGEMYVNNANYETFLVSDTLEKVTIERPISYSHTRPGVPALTIDFDGKVYRSENGNFLEIPQNKIIEERGYEIQEVKWINDSLFVCSTFESGLLFFNANKPNYIDVTNYHSGLPDNEIYALHVDQNNGVWGAHQFGITQISPLFPAYSYSHFPGINGSLTSTNTYNDRLWVTTSLGLYYFDRDTLFETKVYYEVVPSKTSKKPTKTTEKKKSKTKKVAETNEKKPILKRLFGKKKRAENTSNKEDNADKKPKKSKGLFKSIAKVFDGKSEVEKVKGKLDRNAKYIRKTRKTPIDIKYSFKKVEGTDGKFLDVVPYKGKLLGISNSGVYEIIGNEAEMIIEEDIESYTINDLDQLVLSTTYLAVKCYKEMGDIWVEQISQPIGDIIVGLASGKDGTLWLAGANTLYLSELTDSSFFLVDSYDLNNEYLDQVNLLEIKERTYFINSQGYYYYDTSENSIREDKKLSEELGNPINHIFDKSGNAVWVYTGKVWNKIKSDGEVESFEYLGLFPDLRSINSSNDSEHIWLVTNSNDILKYDPDQKNNLGFFNLFVRKVSNEKGAIDQDEKFTLNYDENFLNIQLSKPDFLGLLNPEFQYKLNGLNTEWSEWTKSKTIDFSFLPQGSYELLVRSRDTFGRMEESSALSFKVKPPYWQTPWFYAIQMIFFGSLVLLSTRLNQNNSTNRFLSGALTILTLVLIIEFLQSAISSYLVVKSTPVVDFLFDALVAFMIFPLERILRELMTKGKIKVGVKRGNASLDTNSATE